MIYQSLRFPASFDRSEYAQLVEERRVGGKPLLDLTVSNPTQALLNYPHAEMAQALASISNFSYEPDPLGLSSARSAIAGLYRSRGVEVKIDRIALTASTSEAYSLLFKLLCDPGDQVMVPVPSYPLFEHLALFDSVRVCPYLLRYDGTWHIDFASLNETVSDRTRAVVVVNPNNPTGSFLKRSEAERLCNWAASRRIPVISDEVFTDYRWSTSSTIVESLCELPAFIGFSLNGLSKSCGMPQMKLGWMVLNGPPEHLDQIRARLELLLDTYLSVNTPVQIILPHLLQIGTSIRHGITRTARENLAALRTKLLGTPVHCLTTEGGWTAVLQLPRLRAEEDWVRGLLIDKSVLVQPGYFFDMKSEPYVVVSLLTRPEIFTDGISRLVEYVGP